MSCDPFFVGLSDPFVEDGPPENPPPPVEAAPIYFNGTGDTVITSFNLELGLTVVASTHSGVRNFVVWLKDSQGANVELFVNEIGAYDGSGAVGITSAGQHVLDIDADGDWTIAITQPREVNAPSTTSFAGSGDFATPVFTASSGLQIFDLTYNGPSNFIVWLMDEDGNLEELLANEIGSYTGSDSASVAGGEYLLDVTASGPWAVSIR